MEVSTKDGQPRSGGQDAGQRLDALADVRHGDGLPEGGAGGRAEDEQGGVGGAVGVEDAAFGVEVEAQVGRVDPSAAFGDQGGGQGRASGVVAGAGAVDQPGG